MPIDLPPEFFHPPLSPTHKHKLKYYAELDNVPGLEGRRFMIWHCHCGGRWGITRLGYKRLIRGEITLKD